MAENISAIQSFPCFNPLSKPASFKRKTPNTKHKMKTALHENIKLFQQQNIKRNLNREINDGVWRATEKGIQGKEKSVGFER